MNKEKFINRVNNIMIILTIVSIFIGTRIDLTTPTYDERCKLIYGNDYYYEDTIYGATCVSADYLTLEANDRQPLNTSKELIKERCEKPKFLELSKWKWICN